MHQHPFRLFFKAIFTVVLAVLSLSASAEERIGVLVLHGKNPGSAQDPHIMQVKSRLESEGMQVLLPDMPWSRTRYIDGNWDRAMAEVATHVKALREKGATRIVLLGHSMGVPAALSHAARGGDVQAMVLLAPGHVPLLYYTVPRLKEVRESVDEARALAAAGKGDSRERFLDINQSKGQVVVMTARDYLSYFDPESDAEMSLTAARVPSTVPSLVVIGNKDPLFQRLRAYLFDKLPAHPKTQYLEVEADHLTTPKVSLDAIVEWIKKGAGG